MAETKYAHRVTIACPEHMTYKANQLALIVGESPDDDKTFNALSYYDSLGNMYAVASTVATENFIFIPSMGLPSNPEYALGADRVAAQEALDSINVDGGLLMAIDIDPQNMILEWGFTQVELVI